MPDNAIEVLGCLPCLAGKCALWGSRILWFRTNTLSCVRKCTQWQHLYPICQTVMITGMAVMESACYQVNVDDVGAALRSSSAWSFSFVISFSFFFPIWHRIETTEINPSAVNHIGYVYWLPKCDGFRASRVLPLTTHNLGYVALRKVSVASHITRRCQ